MMLFSARVYIQLYMYICVCALHFGQSVEVSTCLRARGPERKYFVPACVTVCILIQCLSESSHTDGALRVHDCMLTYDLHAMCESMRVCMCLSVHVYVIINVRVCVCVSVCLCSLACGPVCQHIHMGMSLW